MSESTVFVVRIWRGGGPFRATARAVDSEQTSVFSEPVELLRFLAPGSAPALAEVAGGARSAQRASVPSRGTKRRSTVKE